MITSGIKYINNVIWQLNSIDNFVALKLTILWTFQTAQLYLITKYLHVKFLLKGSLRNHDGNGSGNVTEQKN